MIIVLGQGKWGKRLKNDYLKQDKVVRCWSHMMEPFSIEAAEFVVVAIPSPYVALTISQFTINQNIPVYSAVKGLDEFGRLPSQTIKDEWKSKNVYVMGGACISSEKNLQLLIESDVKSLEWAGILKNVYAIGFNIERFKNGDNMAAVWFTKAWEELKWFVGETRYLADFVTTCMSENSRNAKSGKMIAKGEKRLDIYSNLEGEVPEGIHTADMLNKYGKKSIHEYDNLPLLKETVEKIVETGY
jgi:glycerol-3-phosphate dehydrogenase